MIRSIFYIFTCLLVIASNAHSEEVQAPILVLAKPTKVQFLMHEGELSGNQDNNSTYLGSVFTAKLKRLDIISGSYDGAHINVQVIATHKELLTKPEQVLFYIQPSRETPSSGKVLAWWNISRYACVSDRFIQDQSLGDAFDSALAIAGDKCLDIGFAAAK